MGIMQVSKRVGYGLRILMRLAKEPKRHFPARVLAEEEGLPEVTVRQILLRLRKAGLLEAEIGRQGGYWLAKPPEKVSIAAVLRALDEPDLALYGGGRRKSFITPGKGDPTAPFWQKLEKEFWKSLESLTLADLLPGK